MGESLTPEPFGGGGRQLVYIKPAELDKNQTIYGWLKKKIQTTNTNNFPCINKMILCET